MDTVEEQKESGFSFGVTIPSSPVEGEKITSSMIEEKVKEIEEVAEPKKRGRKAGSTNKPKESDTELVKMFTPLVAGLHNGILALLKLSTMSESESKMVGEAWGNLLAKKAPEFMKKYGDWISAGGATALVIGSRLMSETKLFDFTKPKNKENTEHEPKQHNNDTREKGERENSLI